ncbi:MAG: AAA family ATPase [Acidimicrobiales bacterium]
MARVIAVANQKGGVAKTTTTHAIGTAMVERGRKVLLVDLDPQASLTWACGVDPDALEVSIHDVLLKRAKAADAIVDLPAPPPAKPDKPGVIHLLPATIDLAGAELHLLTKTGREYVLRKALSKVADSYDRVIIDCPPSLGILTINGLTAADEVVIPSSASPSASAASASCSRPSRTCATTRTRTSRSAAPSPRCSTGARSSPTRWWPRFASGTGSRSSSRSCRRA